MRKIILTLATLPILLIFNCEFASAELVSATTTVTKTKATTTITSLNKPDQYSITIDKATIDKGYTVDAFKGDLKLSLVPGVLASATPVEVLRLNEKMIFPWSLDRVSDVFQFEFKNKRAYDNHVPYYIQMSYDEIDNQYKQVFFYDKNYMTWRPLPTKDFPKERFVRSLIHLPFARIAIFSFPNTMISGKASWYGYKGGNFAASPDFPKGSRLRVTNIENNKFIDIEVNDYGPDRSIHPDRPIDLDKVAFSQIADLGEGVIDVVIEPLIVVNDEKGYQMGIPQLGIGSEPEVELRASIIVDGEDGRVLYEKNADEVLPLASLTKMVSMYVFLDLYGEKNLDEVVSYSSKDADYNYEYAEPWELAKLNVPDGEKMTVDDLLHSSLMASTNNTVETLVRLSGLDRDNFIELMNKTVHDWGATSTAFYEPTGLDPENVTTARDYAVITQNVLENKVISDISTTKKYEFTTISNKIDKRIWNTNQLVRYGTGNILGSKTGYLDEALYCLMSKVDLGEGESLIIVDLGAPTKADSFITMEKMIQFGKIKSSEI